MSALLQFLLHNEDVFVKVFPPHIVEKIQSHFSIFNRIHKHIIDSDDILLLPHIDPDPDALASCHALYLHLLSLKKQVKIGLVKELQKKYQFIFRNRYNDLILPHQMKSKPDLIVALDIASLKRTGEYQELFKDIESINIDHHIDNQQFGKVNLVDSFYSSASEMMYLYFLANDIEITKNIGETLYTGILYDTGGFRFDCTTFLTHIIIADLLKQFEIDTNEIYEKLFEFNTPGALHLQNLIFSTAELFYDGKMIVTELKKEFYQKAKATKDDALEMVKLGSSIAGVDFHVFYKETEEPYVKISLRSKSNFQVNEVAAKFGGGGHRKAAGITLEGEYNSIKKETLSYFIEQYGNYLQQSL